MDVSGFLWQLYLADEDRCSFKSYCQTALILRYQRMQLAESVKNNSHALRDLKITIDSFENTIDTWQLWVGPLNHQHPIPSCLFISPGRYGNYSFEKQIRKRQWYHFSISENEIAASLQILQVLMSRNFLKHKGNKLEEVNLHLNQNPVVAWVFYSDCFCWHPNPTVENNVHLAKLMGHTSWERRN